MYPLLAPSIPLPTPSIFPVVSFDYSPCLPPLHSTLSYPAKTALGSYNSSSAVILPFADSKLRIRGQRSSCTRPRLPVRNQRDPRSPSATFKRGTARSPREQRKASKAKIDDVPSTYLRRTQPASSLRALLISRASARRDGDARSVLHATRVRSWISVRQRATQRAHITARQRCVHGRVRFHVVLERLLSILGCPTYA